MRTNSILIAGLELSLELGNMSLDKIVIILIIIYGGSFLKWPKYVYTVKMITSGAAIEDKVVTVTFPFHFSINVDDPTISLSGSLRRLSTAFGTEDYCGFIEYKYQLGPFPVMSLFLGNFTDTGAIIWHCNPLVMKLEYSEKLKSLPWLLMFRALIQYKESSYQYRKSHCGHKMVIRSSYFHNGISYTGKMTSLYWIRALVPYVVSTLAALWLTLSDREAFLFSEGEFQVPGPSQWWEMVEKATIYYHKISGVRGTKSQNLNNYCLFLQLSWPNPM